MGKFVSIIVLNYNGKKFLKECIDSLLQQTYKNFEIVFVDNDSHDDSVAFVKKRYKKHISSKKMKLVLSNVNTGFAEGNNLGIRNAKGPYIVLLNNDTIVTKNWLAEMVKALEKKFRGKDIMLVSAVNVPRQVKNMKKVLYAKELFRTINLLGNTISLGKEPPEIEDMLCERFYIGGSSIIFRKKQFPIPFDKEYFAYSEDIYLGWRAQLRGGAVVAATAARFHHFGSGTSGANKKINKISMFHGTKNEIVNILLFYSCWTTIRVLPLLAFSQFAHMVFNPRKIPLKCKAYLWILAHPRYIWKLRRKLWKERKVSEKELLCTMSSDFFDERTVQIKNPVLLQIIKVCNKLFLAYCWLVRLRTKELTV